MYGGHYSNFRHFRQSWWQNVNNQTSACSDTLKVCHTNVQEKLSISNNTNTVTQKALKLITETTGELDPSTL